VPVPGPRRSLRERDLLDAALALLAERGAAGVSVRAIAARVGVAPNAVYTYFPDRAAVLAALADDALGRADPDLLSDPARPPAERIVAFALDLRAALLADPGVVTLVGGVPPLSGPHVLTITERLLGALADLGLDEVAAARGAYLLTVHVLGSVALEVAELTEPGPPPPEADRVAARAAGFAGIPAERYPRSAAAAATMAENITTGQFRWGLERILDGLVSGGAEPPAARAGRR
jgi:TetR/AcrR family transcriptional regulator, tetracycline repressor protein